MKIDELRLPSDATFERCLAEVSITPSMGCIGDPIPVVLLNQYKSGYKKISAQVVEDEVVSFCDAKLKKAEVETWIEKLKHARVPAYPVSPCVQDGSYIEVSIHGEMADLKAGWWTAAPQGYDTLAEFVDWLAPG